jgi:hypothetical protein
MFDVRRLMFGCPRLNFDLCKSNVFSFLVEKDENLF